MPKTVRFTKTAVRIALEDARGIKSDAARKLGVSRQTLDNYMVRYPELKEVMDKARDSLVDAAESKLSMLVEAGEIRAVLFTLETLGKNRGYSKRTEVTGADGANLMQLSPETLEALRMMGIAPSDVVRQFEDMIRSQTSPQPLSTMERGFKSTD